MFTSIDQRAYIKLKVTDRITQGLEQACGDQTLSYSQVAQCVVDPRKGREAIQNDHRNGRPATMTDDYNIEKVSNLLKSDRRFM